MYIYDGIVSQNAGASGGWGLSYICNTELAFSPSRATIRVNDLGNERADGSITFIWIPDRRNPRPTFKFTIGRSGVHVFDQRCPAIST